MIVTKPAASDSHAWKFSPSHGEACECGAIRTFDGAAVNRKASHTCVLVARLMPDALECAMGLDGFLEVFHPEVNILAMPDEASHDAGKKDDDRWLEAGRLLDAAPHGQAPTHRRRRAGR